MVDVQNVIYNRVSLLVGNLTWLAPVENNSPITQYTVYVCALNLSTDCSSTQNISTTSPAALVGVDPLEEYNITIIATNEVGDSDVSVAKTVSGAQEGTHVHVYTLVQHVHVCAVLLCLFVCLTLIASFFLPSHLSLKHVHVHVYIYIYIYMYIHIYTCLHDST